MADKYIKQVAGVRTEVEATAVSTGVTEAGDIVALDANGKLDTTLMPTGVGADTASILASENLAAGDFINIWDDAAVVWLFDGILTLGTSPNLKGVFGDGAHNVWVIKYAWFGE